MGVSNLSSHFVFIFVHLFAVAILSSGSGTHFHGYLFGCSVISSTVIGPLRLKIFDHLDPDEHLIASSPSFVCICTLFLYWSLVIIPIKNNVVLVYVQGSPLPKAVWLYLHFCGPTWLLCTFNCWLEPQILKLWSSLMELILSVSICLALAIANFAALLNVL